jgi:hypothetical protein
MLIEVYDMPIGIPRIDRTLAQEATRISPGQKCQGGLVLF